MKERGMAKVQESIEGGLVGVRDDLGKMEGVVESLNGTFHFLPVREEIVCRTDRVG